MALPIGTMLVREEMFTFTHESGEKTHILSGALRTWLKAAAMSRVMDLTFPDETLEEIIQKHGIEMDRLNSMTEEEAKEPVIVGDMGNGSMILVDGAHRRAFWARRGIRVLRGWCVPRAIWEEFQFDPKDVVGTIYEDGHGLPQRKKKD